MMGIEIERKFLVIGDDWKILTTPVLMRQGYLNADPERVVRVRIEDDQAVITVKGKANGIARAEWEYSIPVDDANVMLETLCESSLIEKKRYRISFEGFVWEVDEFLGENVGLVVAEVELQALNQTFSLPAWIGGEVSEDHRYANSSLSKHPFSCWQNTN